MPVAVASLVVGAYLVAAATAKAVDRPGTVVAMATYGLSGRSAGAAWGVLVALEMAVGGLLLAGWPGAAVAASALLSVFVAGQAAALATGRGGAPCGCLGGRGRLNRTALGRTMGLLGLAGLAAVAWEPAPGWAAAGAAAAALAAGLWRIRPAGALDVSDEGPDVGERLAVAGAGEGPRLLVFVSEGCGLCRRLRRPLAQLERDGISVRRLDEERDAAAWLAARVPGSPYAVVVDAEGTVLAKGTANTGRQLRSLLTAAGVGAKVPHSGTNAPRAGGMGRRALLRLGAGVAGAAAVGRLVRPGEAEAYHFCGHIYTTDSCPHPTGLPRIDARGLPLRARDGHAVDDLGRLIDRDGMPVDEDGEPLRDADGRLLPPATRTTVCAATGREYGIPVRVDGSWYRCCGGTVRKLVDCCSTHPRRINGDKALRGYCYGPRKVFCVMYFQTRVPC